MYIYLCSYLLLCAGIFESECRRTFIFAIYTNAQEMPNFMHALFKKKEKRKLKCELNTERIITIYLLNQQIVARLFQFLADGDFSISICGFALQSGNRVCYVLFNVI